LDSQLQIAFFATSTKRLKMTKNILFVCTGNYYRSRFAEEYFNHLAEKNRLNWVANSRGLSQNMPSLNNPGPISVHTLEALHQRGIEGKCINRYPRPMEKADFTRYDRIVAMSDEEHRPMMKARFLAHCNNVEYFEVGDLPLEEPTAALQKITVEVDQLVDVMLINENNYKKVLTL
jgi:protein-tyrosine phosphatase